MVSGRKKFRITIEGEVFEVEVLEEELEKAVKVREGKQAKSPVEQRSLLLPIAKGQYILSPMAGKVTSLKKKIGDPVALGETVAVLESMKTLVEVKSDKEGIVEEVFVKEGDFVDFNKPILKLKKGKL
ncbi:MAG: acetyl-CoA carboxylase biotin carboxyl carrier protein subunit [Thermoproteales archaeon]|nr:acetyl-CoA carboxylase biotin carboxyl carrier protein subunit [Thermoproteales archaeon]